jgi:hydrogenase maturation protein HypF
MLRGHVDPRTWGAVARLAHTRLASPLTSSAGRLFDAIAALCGLRWRVSYEGQAAIELEMAADPRGVDRYPIPLRPDSGQLVLDARAMVVAAEQDLANGRPVSEVAACAHNALSQAATDACGMLAERHGVRTIVLSGGVFQNVLLLERTARALTRAGLRVLVPERLPPNDGGLSYGQAVIAASREHRGGSEGRRHAARPA